MDSFVKHLERATAIVKNWPKWKQTLLGGRPVPKTRDSQIRTPEDRGAFDRQLKQAKAVVESWPQWKQDAVRAAVTIPQQPNYRNDQLRQQCREAAERVKEWPEEKQRAAKRAVNVYTTSGLCVSNPKLGRGK